MRREMKISVSVALSLMLGFILLSSPSTVKSVTASTKQQSQTAAPIQDHQMTIGRITISSDPDRQSLVATGIEFLDRRIGNDFFVLTTFAKLEELRQQGFPVKLLYFRELDFHGTWKSAETFGGECTYTIDRTQKILTGDGGIAGFKLTTGEECEWVAFSDSPWLQLNGIGQGTGSTTLDAKIAMNPGVPNRIGHIFVQGNVFTVYQGATFADVPLSHPFYLEIGKISALGITVGCGGNNFCPDSAVAREQMAPFLVRAMGEFNPPVPAMQRFADVPPSSVYYNFIDRLAVLGITQGCNATDYCPSVIVNRDQMSLFIMRSLGEFNPPTPPAQRFVDVPPSHPQYNFIERLAALGITQGCNANPPMFCPGMPVTRGMMAVFMVRAFHIE
jgi:hypothetical protein